MDALNIGTILHGNSYHYTIVKTLGQGTFGITYLASVKMTGSLGSLDSEILVAVKEFFMRDFNGRHECSVTYSSKDGAYAYYKSKFIHEAENLSKLHDPGIIKVIEQFEENQTAYYVMEYVSHGSLDNLIKLKGKLSSAECGTYAIQIARALKYMHHCKMLHLDLKPNNVMINKNDQIVLIDFGLSKRFDACGNPETSTTIGSGTPGYAPIEQSNYKGSGNEEFPATMDIYALGATMFKMLTGDRPPEASFILNDGFPTDDLKQVNATPMLIDIVRSCMEPVRKNRYQSVEDVLNALISASKTFNASNNEINKSDSSSCMDDTILDDCKKIESTLAVFEMPSDSVSISVIFKPANIGGPLGKGFFYNLKSTSAQSDSFYEDTLVNDWSRLIDDFKRLKILVGKRIKDSKDYSEDPAELSIQIESISKGQIQLSLVAFNTDMLAGNIYNANILDLAESIERVMLKHIPRKQESTPELIYSIPNPDDISEIWIDYSEAGIVGLAKNYRLRIGNNKNALLSSEVEYTCNRDEVICIVNGLKGLKLHSQGSINVDNTGEVLETLTISFYGKKGNLIKKFYAQDNGNRCVGSIAIHVSRLKNEIIKTSPSFKKQIIDRGTEVQNKKSKISLSDIIFAIVGFSILIGLPAITAYQFVNLSNESYIWLWLSIGATEMCVILFGIGSSINISSKALWTTALVFGILSFITIFLWICQMYYWI